MNHHPRPLVVGLAALVVGAAALPAQAAGAEQDQHARAVTTSGLFSPLSLAVEGDGTIYVSQNFAGQLMRIERGQDPQPIAAVEGGEIGAVSVRGGVVTYAVSRGNNEEGRIRQIKGGRDRILADIGAFERRANPDGASEYGFASIPADCAAQLPAEGPPASYSGVVETHPYATATGTGGTVYVADAGANAVFAVLPKGAVRTVAVLPGPQVVLSEQGAESLGFPACTVGLTYRFESVPTDVEVGPSGQLIVSTLPGGPEDGGGTPVGAVYRVNPATGTTTRLATGLVSATGVAIASDGTVYVNQLFGGEISRIEKGTGAVQTFQETALPGDVEVVGGRVWATGNVLSGLSGEEGDVPDGRVLTFVR